MAVPAPGRLSTTTARPSVSLIPSATARASRSAAPPAAYGLISVIGRAGKDWGSAPPADADMATTIASSRRVMLSSRGYHAAAPRWRATGAFRRPAFALG